MKQRSLQWAGLHLPLPRHILPKVTALVDASRKYGTSLCLEVLRGLNRLLPVCIIKHLI